MPRYTRNTDNKQSRHQVAGQVLHEPDSSEGAPCNGLSAAKETPIKIDQRLVDISYFTRKNYDVLMEEDSRFRQMYFSEHHKLVQTIAAFQALVLENTRLAQENTRCKQRTIPGYDRQLDFQVQEMGEMRKKLQAAEFANTKLEQLAYRKEGEFASAIHAMVRRTEGLIETIKTLETENRELLTIKNAL